MRPAERRDVRQEFGLNLQSGAFSLSDRFAEMDGILVDHDRSEKVETGPCGSAGFRSCGHGFHPESRRRQEIMQVVCRQYRRKLFLRPAAF